MNLADILKSLTKSAKRTSAELRADLAKIDMPALEAKVDNVERRRRDLLLRGTDAELNDVSQALSQANLDAERGQALIDELNRLILESEEREHLDNIEATAAEARGARDRLVAHYSDVDRLAAELGDILAKIVTDRATIKAANQVVIGAARSDLKTGDPAGELAQLLGFANSDGLPDPTRWLIAGYWPRADRFGTPINAARPFGRVRELLHDSAIKKAA